MKPAVHPCSSLPNGRWSSKRPDALRGIRRKLSCNCNWTTGGHSTGMSAAADTLQPKLRISHNRSFWRPGSSRSPLPVTGSFGYWRLRCGQTLERRHRTRSRQFTSPRGVSSVGILIRPAHARGQLPSVPRALRALFPRAEVRRNRSKQT